MIVGRVAEREAIDALLRRASAGDGGGLVLRGEPGIGKTTLLEYAGRRAATMTVLRARGVEPEADIGYAALHQLLHPVTDRLAALPGPQRGALDIVFGRAAGPPPDRFLVGLATLSLLCDVAVDRPVLCLVDDAHWVDGASAGVLTFVARRLGTEPVALLAAARADEGRPFTVPELADLPLGGLDQASARTLLAAALPDLDRLPADRMAALLRATGGNPLALRELPGAVGLSGTDGSGSSGGADGSGWAQWPLDPAEPIPLAAGLRRTYLARAERYGADLRLLLLVAADGTGRLDILGRAAGHLGIDAARLTADAVAGLLAIDRGRIGYRHPLMRAAVYHGAAPADRRAAHAALATAWAGDDDAGHRRAWHLGRAASSPDETVARALEDSAAQTLRRAGATAAAAALEGAAELSPSTRDQTRRTVAAAEAWWAGGDAVRAAELLDRAEALGPLDGAVQLDAVALRAVLQVRAGSPGDAVTLLLPVLPPAMADDRARAVRLLMLLGEAGYQSNGATAFERAGAVVADLRIDGHDEADVLARMYRAAYQVRAGGSAALSAADRNRLETLSEPTSLAWAGGLAYGIGEPDLARALHRRAVDRARRLGAVGTLAWVLDYFVADALGRSGFGTAEALAEEGMRFALETGQPNVACRHRAALALVAAIRGRDEEARRLAGSVLAEAAERGLGSVGATAQRALALADLVVGRPADALVRLSALGFGTQTHPGIALQAVPDRVEAAALAGVPESVTTDAERFASWAQAAGSPQPLALSARCAALLGPPQDAEASYLRAVQLHRVADHPMEHARTELLLGEHLRRQRRRQDARVHLRTALDVFGRLGAQPWAQRARAELRAAGERVPDAATPAGLASLTPQEARIVAAVREGLTNREIAAGLFLSPRTVDYHLRKVFQKLGVSARAQLARFDS